MVWSLVIPIYHGLMPVAPGQRRAAERPASSHPVSPIRGRQGVWLQAAGEAKMTQSQSQSQLLARRRLLTGALLLAVAFPAMGASRARAANAFDGTWAGVDANGETVQAIFADGQILGFYWRGDYTEPTGAKLGAGGSSLTFSFSGGRATIARDGARMTVVIHDKRGESRIDLKKD